MEPACSSSGREGSSYTVPSLPPSLTHSCTHAPPPPQFPGPKRSSCQAQKPGGEHTAQPSCQLPSNPPWANPHGMQQMLSIKGQEKYPSPSSVGRSAGLHTPTHTQEDRGRAGRVRSVGLGAEVSQEHKQPHAPRDGGPRCPEEGRPQEVLPHTQAPPFIPGVGEDPTALGQRPRHARGWEGTLAQFLLSLQ